MTASAACRGRPARTPSEPCRWRRLGKLSGLDERDILRGDADGAADALGHGPARQVDVERLRLRDDDHAFLALAVDTERDHVPGADAVDGPHGSLDVLGEDVA